MTIEECLNQVESKAALVRYLANNAMVNGEPPDSAVMSGVGDVCGEIEALAQAVRRGLDPRALTLEPGHRSRSNH